VGHRAALYTVAVHRAGGSSQELLGDIDGAGSNLLKEFARYFPLLNTRSRPDGSKSLSYLRSKVENNELLVSVEHGQDGLAAIIRDQSGQEQYRQNVEDWQIVECGALFDFVPNERLGWLALHVNNGRGTKTMMEQYLRERFHEDFRGLTFVIKPFVMESVLRQAVDQDRISTIKLVKRQKPADRAEAAVNPWVAAGVVGKIETTITSSLGGRARNLVSGLLRDYLDGRPGARDAIVEFEGLRYDEAKVIVKQGNGTRTYNIEEPASGHPVTVDLDLGLSPSTEDVYGALRAALSCCRT
jgi:hypothetical protein